jgi:Protein of unknown function (DUF2914)
MSEKKNIVIKVKYPTADSPSAKPVSTPNVTTQWDYKRIGLVFGCILIIFFSIFYFSGSDDSESSSTAQLAPPIQPTENKTQPTIANNLPSKPKVDINKLIIRSQLTKDIEKNEPIDQLKLPLKIGKKETLGIYYFAELKGMKGKTIYHEWLLNGELITRKRVNISADPWRTASKQVISYTMNNDWVVRLVDDSGNKLVEKGFNLELN